ncbi:uncharacterized protein LOC121051627 isoform X2 [Rosa chinensis]|uniref:uncharacterized protein LOC121051627 isoform X2 n=1 Tax=Rosa chinensis TaxID=74649 RepID=UPI001AD8CFC7|nr:uncharacterized protein LOC121051627 isoform X2 [Rosa chinensis]
MTDEDIIVSVLLGLPSAYTTMKTIIRAKHNPISMQELRSLLLIAEAELEEVDKSLSLPSTTEIIAQDDNIRGSTPAPTLITNAKSDVNSMMPTSSVASSIGYNVHSMSNSSPSQSAASPGPQPPYMTNASSPCTPTFVDYLQTSYLGFPQPSANTCLTQPTDFFAHNNGGLLQRFGAHMPQMQTNSYLLQLVAPSTFTPCHASNDYAVTPSISISNGATHSMPNSGYGMNNGTGNENFNGGCMVQNSGYNHVPQYNHSHQQGFFLNNDSYNGMPPQQGFHSLSTNITYSAAGYTEDKMNCPNFSNRGTNYFNRGCDYKDDNNKPRRSNNSSPHNPIVCQICGKRGHCAYNCYQRNSQPHNIALSSYVKCQICRTSGHIAKLCRYKQQSQTSSQPKSASIAAQPSSCSSMPLISPVDVHIWCDSFQVYSPWFSALLNNYTYVPA